MKRLTNAEKAELHKQLEEAEKAKFKPYENKIAELEKENAELKDYRLNTLKEQQTGIQKYALNLEHKLNWYDDQLTKAKEIIKALLSVFVYDLADDEMDAGHIDTKIKAEQFLNEVEK